MINPGLNGKTALITGANNPMGIGAAVALALAAQGVTIYVTYHRVPVGEEAHAATVPGEQFYNYQQTYTASHLVRKIREMGGRANSCEADLVDATLVPLLFDRVEAAFGTSVDILINNAAHCVQDTLIPPDYITGVNGGLAPDGIAMHPFTAESHDRHFAVNARAPALLMAEFARRNVQERKQWGRIVNISTDASDGFAGEVSYGASKHALESYTRAAAKEFGSFGITVNIASLGPIQTGWIAPEMEETTAQHTPLGRVGTPDDVGDAVVLLCSDQARWITGQLIYVGGGHRM